MIELSRERIEQILHEETLKSEDLKTILRSIYHRYMRLYEDYFSDIDTLNDEKIARLNKYHEETKSLVKYYYMDIPMDVCMGIDEFEEKYGSKLLGPDWHNYVFESYQEFKDRKENKNKSEECLKAEFKEKVLDAFYGVMGYVFREGFGTGSRTHETFIDGITGLLFGKNK